MKLIPRLLIVTATATLVMAASPDHSPEPAIYGADPTLTLEIGVAIDRFSQQGLTLPELSIYFHDDSESCDGHGGLFTGETLRIDLCTDTTHFIYHELAHAWAHHSLTEDTRQAFVEHVGAPSWANGTDPHDQRGTELAADAIAHGLRTEALSDAEALRTAWVLERYLFLTGRQSPRLTT